MTLVDEQMWRVVAGLGQRLRVAVLVGRVDFYPTVPGPGFGKFETVGLPGPFQHPTLVLRDIAVAEAEEWIHWRPEDELVEE